jgi:signal transduction histidine kinase
MSAIKEIYFIQGWVLLVVPMAFIAAGLHGRLIQAAVADQLARLSHRMSTDEIADALRRALRDDRIDIFYWASHLSSYVDRTGRVVSVPAESTEQVVLPLNSPEKDRLAVLVADPELARAAVLLSYAVTASRAPLLTACIQAARSAEKEQQYAQQRLVEQALWAQRVRLGRDLHDGAQQRLSALGFLLARAEKESKNPSASNIIQEMRTELNSVLQDVRRIAHGLAPVQLVDGGLQAAVSSLCEMQDVPIQILLEEQRHPAEVEVLAYNVIAEALTNIGKYANASLVIIRGRKVGSDLEVQVIDNGVGGATVSTSSGTGLAGIRGRVNAVGGCFNMASPPGTGTKLTVRIPCV